MAAIYFVFASITAFFLTIAVKYVMTRAGIVDVPKSSARKIHKKKIPLGGGLAMYLTFFLVVGMMYQSGGMENDVSARTLLALFLGGTVIMIGGLMDDYRPLTPLKQLIAPVIATIILIAFGIGPTEVTNPFGSVFRLDQWRVSLGAFGSFVVLADLLVFFWMMGMMYTTKLLDGLDGLVTGISLIGAIVIFFLTQQPEWFQPGIGRLALVFAGSALGFLFFNSHPARMFLGEGGSLFAGFIIGALAIISGSKIATTLLVMGIPMLDIVRVMIRRFQLRRSLFQGDNEHLHFKLLQSGLSHTQAVYLFYAMSLLFGLVALFVQNEQKVVALIFLVVLMMLVGVFFTKKDNDHAS